MGKPDLSMIINGCLAGLVAITAGCAVISPLGSVIVGAIGGVLVVVSVITFDKIKIDDRLEPVCASCKWSLGTLAVGLFAVRGVLMESQDCSMVVVSGRCCRSWPELPLSVA